MFSSIAVSANTQLDQVNCCCVELLLFIKFTKHRNKNEQVAQEETPVEDTVTLSMAEYQKMKEAIEDIDKKIKAKIKGKVMIERTIIQHAIQNSL